LQRLAVGVVAVCVAFNVISLVAILTAPETLRIDMNRIDLAQEVIGALSTCRSEAAKTGEAWVLRKRRTDLG
jgi:hypothetical protein